jgi:hypothetical protein
MESAKQDPSAVDDFENRADDTVRAEDEKGYDDRSHNGNDRAADQLFLRWPMPAMSLLLV